MNQWLQNLVDGAIGALDLVKPHWQRWRQCSTLPTAEELEDLVVALESKLDQSLSLAFDQLDAYLGVRCSLAEQYLCPAWFAATAAGAL